MNPFHMSPPSGEEPNPTPYVVYGNQYPPSVLYQGIPSETHTVNPSSEQDIALSYPELEGNSSASPISSKSRIKLLSSILPPKYREEFIGDWCEWKQHLRERLEHNIPVFKKSIRHLVNLIALANFCFQVYHLARESLNIHSLETIESLLTKIENLLKNFLDAEESDDSVD